MFKTQVTLHPGWLKAGALLIIVNSGLVYSQQKRGILDGRNSCQPVDTENLAYQVQLADLHEFFLAHCQTLLS